MIVHLNLKTRAVLLQVVAAGLILGAASLGANWVFSRMGHRAQERVPQPLALHS